MMKMKIKKLLLTGVISLGLASSSYALAPDQIKQIYIFGDSLSDMGYQDANPNVPTTKEPTWTSPNGYPWPHYLALDMGKTITANNQNPLPVSDTPYVTGTLSGTDYAAGGATSSGPGFSITAEYTHYNPPATDIQIQNFLAQHDQRVDPDALYIIWVGANNVFKAGFDAAMAGPPIDPVALAETTATTLADQIVAQIATLYAHAPAGQHLHIVVIDLPDLGATGMPQLMYSIATKMGASPDLNTITTLLAKFSLLVNTRLEQAISAYESRNPVAKHVNIVDVYRVLTYLFTQPASPTAPLIYKLYDVTYSFINNHDPACGALICSALSDFPPPTLSDPTHYVFEDAVHPTDQTHQMIANIIFHQIINTDF